MAPNLLRRILAFLTVTLRWSAWTTAYLACAGAVLIWNHPAYLDWRLACARHDAIQEQLSREKETVARLESEKKALSTDALAIERAAREEYLMLKAGERVFVIETATAPADRPRP